jgi:signal transduction histidine kinase
MRVEERLGEVRADERKIRQVVLNLLSNAIKFTPEGGRIEVAAVPRDGFVEVSVSHTGVGIALMTRRPCSRSSGRSGLRRRRLRARGSG